MSLLTRGRPNLVNLTCLTYHPSSTLNTMIGTRYTEPGRFVVTFPSVVALQYGIGNMSHRSCGGKKACCHRCLYAPLQSRITRLDRWTCKFHQTTTNVQRTSEILCCCYTVISAQVISQYSVVVQKSQDHLTLRFVCSQTWIS
jgi:hypothetical protein